MAMLKLNVSHLDNSDLGYEPWEYTRYPDPDDRLIESSKFGTIKIKKRLLPQYIERIPDEEIKDWVTKNKVSENPPKYYTIGSYDIQGHVTAMHKEVGGLAFSSLERAEEVQEKLKTEPLFELGIGDYDIYKLEGVTSDDVDNERLLTQAQMVLQNPGWRHGEEMEDDPFADQFD